MRAVGILPNDWYDSLILNCKNIIRSYLVWNQIRPSRSSSSRTNASPTPMSILTSSLLAAKLGLDSDQSYATTIPLSSLSKNFRVSTTFFLSSRTSILSRTKLMKISSFWGERSLKMVHGKAIYLVSLPV